MQPQDDPDVEVFRLLSQACGNSTVVGFVPSTSSLIAFVGVLGLYVGLIDAVADTTEFPTDGTHDLGHVMVLREGKIERQSLRDAARRLKGMLESGWLPQNSRASRRAVGDEAFNDM